MATDYTVVASNRTVLVRSATLTEDVEELHVVTKPSGVTFVRDVLYTVWKSGAWKAGIELIAQHIEHIFAVRPHVIAASGVQQVDAQGLISNAVEFIVSVDGTSDANPGPFQSTVTIPVQVLHDDDAFDSYFDATIASLTATANS